MKTNFQSGEILTASDLNANFTECASKADSNTTYTKTQVDTALYGKTGEYAFDQTQTSGSQQINLDTYLTQGSTGGVFHIYNGRSSAVNLDALLTSSIEDANFVFFGNYKNIPSSGQILCHICRHDTTAQETYYLVYVINRDEKVTSLSSSSTDAQYPSAKCVFDRISLLAARGKFLSLWSARRGLPMSFPESTPYTYHTGDYYIVDTSGRYKHEISLSCNGYYLNGGVSTGSGCNLSFILYTDSSTQLSTLDGVAGALNSLGYNSSDKRLTCNTTTSWSHGSAPTNLIQSIAAHMSGDDKIITFSPSNIQNGGVTSIISITDTVTDLQTLYKPNGSSFTGTTSTTEAEALLADDDTYYFDGTTWILQHHAQS